MCIRDRASSSLQTSDNLYVQESDLLYQMAREGRGRRGAQTLAERPPSLRRQPPCRAPHLERQA
eukprot:5586481-Alexandrium_andersonii.AAC.1